MSYWVRELIIRLAFLGLGFLLAQVLAPMQAQGAQAFQGADGQWHQHDSKWEGLWIAQDFPSCCGERDCFKSKQGAEVTVERLENGNGFMVTWAGQEPEFIPHNSPNLRPSQDGEYWACHRLVNGDGTKQTRCLFVPPLGF